MTPQEARAAFLAHRPMLVERGVSWYPGTEPRSYWPSDFRQVAMDAGLALDAVPAIGSNPNVGIPTLFTTYVDPKVYKWILAALAIADIIGEERRIGDWAEQTAMFPVAEPTGETTSYSDYADGGRPSDYNANWPQYQQYLFQAVIDYGDLEVERFSRAKINVISEKQEARARNLNTFLNFIYAFGVAFLQNYGLLNDPLLSASLTPGPKAYGGTAWQVGTVTRATPNEIFTDIQSLITLAVQQTLGRANMKSRMTLALGPVSHMAITATNSFNVNTTDLLKKNFPNLEINGEAVQYSAQSSINPQGVVAGNLMQLIVHEIEGQQTGFAAYGEKLRTFPVIRQLSSFRQKAVSGGWGTVIRMPMAIASMIGI